MDISSSNLRFTQLNSVGKAEGKKAQSSSDEKKESSSSSLSKEESKSNNKAFDQFSEGLANYNIAIFKGRPKKR